MHRQDERASRGWILGAATLGYALVILDVTAMNVVAPVIQQELTGPVSLVQWVINAYTLTLAALLLLGGILADRYGCRLVIGTGALLFGVASLAAALSPSPVPLIIARGVQGIGSALMVPAGLGLIAGHYPAEARGRAIGLWAGIAGLAAITGPLLGGLLSDLASWRWLFALYLPFSLVVILITITRLPASKRPTDPRPVDLVGAATATMGLLLVVWALIQAGNVGFRDALVVIGLAGGAVLLAVFLFVERSKARPMLDLGMLRQRDHAGAQAVTFLLYFALAAGMLFVPMRLMGIDDWRPTWAGAAMLPTLVMIGVFSPFFGAWLPRHGARRLATVGALVAASGYLVLAVPGPGTSYFAGILWGLLLVGLGMAMLMAPLTATILHTAQDAEAARAAGLNNAVSRLGALFAIALAGIIALTAQAGVLAQGLDEIPLDDEDREAAWQARTDLAQAQPPDSVEGDARQRLAALYQEGFLAGYRAVQLTMAAAALLGAAVAWVVLTPRAGR